MLLHLKGGCLGITSALAAPKPGVVPIPIGALANSANTARNVTSPHTYSLVSNDLQDLLGRIKLIEMTFAKDANLV